MRFAHYEPLAEWANEHRVRFHVDWYPDCHILSAIHELDNGLVCWAYVKYPHKGDKRDLRPWGYDSTLREFVGRFEELCRHMPMQPTDSDEYMEVTV